MTFKIGDKVQYLRFGKMELEYEGIVEGYYSQKTIIVNCGGEKYLAPVDMVTLTKEVGNEQIS